MKAQVSFETSEYTNPDKELNVLAEQNLQFINHLQPYFAQKWESAK